MPEFNRSPLDSLSQSQKDSLSLFLGKALTKDWQNIQVNLSGLGAPLTLTRQDGERFFHQQYIAAVATQGVGKWLTQEELKNPEKLKETENYLLEKQFGPQKSDLAGIIRKKYEACLESQVRNLDSPTKPLLSTQEAKKAATAAERIETTLDPQIEAIIEPHLVNYPEDYKRQVRESIKKSVRQSALRRLEAQKPLDQEFAQAVVGQVRTQPLLRAAIRNSGALERDLAQKLPQANVTGLAGDYATFRNYQLSLSPAWQNIFTQISSSGVDPGKAGRTLEDMNQYLGRFTALPNPYVLGQNLRAALGSQAVEALRAKGIDVDTLGWQISAEYSRSQNLLYPKKFTKMAEKLAVQPKALAFYTQGIASNLITVSSPEDLVLKQEVEKLEQAQKRRFFGGAQGQAEKMHRETNKNLEKTKKAYAHQEWIKTSQAAWLRNPIQKTRYTINQSSIGKAWTAWGRKVDNFKENSPLGWVLAPRYRLRKAVGNWLLKKAKGKVLKLAAKTLLKFGFSAATKLLLGSAFGPVGIAIAAAWTGIKTFYRVFRDPRLRKKILSFAARLGASAAYGLYMLFAHYPATMIGFFAGLTFFGPFAPIAAPGLAFVGFLVDSTLGGLKGVGSAVAQAAVPAAEAAAAFPGQAVQAAAGAASQVTPVAVGGAIAVPAVATIFTFMVLSSAFFVPGEGGQKQYGSEYITVSKFPRYNATGPGGQITEQDLAQDIAVSYDVIISAPKADLFNIKVTDTVLAIGESQKELEIKPLPQFPSGLTFGDSQTQTYSVTVSKAQLNSRLVNQVVVEADIISPTTNEPQHETNRASFTITIGKPPLLPQVTLAYDIINALQSCGLPPGGSGVVVNQKTWPTAKNCLLKSGIDQQTISLLEESVKQYNNLQCVGLAKALASRAGISLPAVASAAEYCQKSGLQTDFAKLEEGDFVVTAAGPGGHIAMVTRRLGQTLELVEAIGDYGYVQLNSERSVDALKSIYCGFFKGQ